MIIIDKVLHVWDVMKIIIWILIVILVQVNVHLGKEMDLMEFVFNVFKINVKNKIEQPLM